ncbi:hypothetical protein BurJ1DRAFT_0246 [Burkholderiales bacterium JOSHI_001]|nr:hypothetical protein BurJ1DRAFT_0246 [Burkholderiales bacterium JOSHI_001]
MTPRAALLPWFVRAGLWLALGSMAACAAQTVPPVPAPARPRGLVALPPQAPTGPRVIVLLAQDAPDADALRERLAAVAQVPVSVLRPLSPRRWAVALQCEGQAACAGALDRLAAERGLVLSVEPDLPVQLPPRPSGAVAH